MSDGTASETTKKKPGRKPAPPKTGVMIHVGDGTITARVITARGASAPDWPEGVEAGVDVLARAVLGAGLPGTVRKEVVVGGFKYTPNVGVATVI